MVSCIMHNYTFVMPSLVINGRRQCVCGLSVRACVHVCKVKVNRSALYISPLSLKRSDMAHGPYPKGITQFYLPPTHEPYLYLLPSRKATPPFRAFPRRDGQAELTWVADYVCEHVSQHNVLQTACANFTKFRCIWRQRWTRFRGQKIKSQGHSQIFRFAVEEHLVGHLYYHMTSCVTIRAWQLWMSRRLVAAIE